MKESYLITKCSEFISQNTLDVFSDPSFDQADKEVVDTVASLDYLGVEELEAVSRDASNGASEMQTGQSCGG